MRIAEDIVAVNGLVLIGRGISVTEMLLERLTNYKHIVELIEPVWAVVPPRPRPGRRREPVPPADGRDLWPSPPAGEIPMTAPDIRARIADLLVDGSAHEIAFIERLVASFLERAPVMLTDLETAIAAADASAAAHKAHALKGRPPISGRAVSPACAPRPSAWPTRDGSTRRATTPTC
nr:hypothetical protein GCM10020093_016050 [Planobispora longispora]